MGAHHGETLFLELDRTDRPRSDSRARGQISFLFFFSEISLFNFVRKNREKKRPMKRRAERLIADDEDSANESSRHFFWARLPRGVSRRLRKNEIDKNNLRLCAERDTAIPAYAITNLANTWRRGRRRYGRPSFTKCPKFNELFLYRYHWPEEN